MLKLHGRSLRELLVSSLFMPALLLAQGCASDTYHGIYVGPGSGQTEWQRFAIRARAGDREAQYQLGVHILEDYGAGRATIDDLKVAERLLRDVMTDRGGTTAYIYSPVIPGRDGGGVMAFYQGPHVEGIAAARAHWIEARSLLESTRAANKAPYGNRDEVFIGKRLEVDRRLGRPDMDSVAIQSIGRSRAIAGVFYLTARFGPESEICRAMESYIDFYVGYGFRNCRVDKLQGVDIRTRQEETFYILDYEDNYRETEEYIARRQVSHMPLYVEPYRSSFIASAVVLDDGLRALCGVFAIYEMRLVESQFSLIRDEIHQNPDSMDSRFELCNRYISGEILE